MTDFRSALKTIGLPPCEKYECPKRQECADKRLACSAFAHWCDTGVNSHPTILWTSGVRKRIHGTAIAATREIYEKGNA